MWLNVAIASRGRRCNKQSGTTSSWNNAAIVSRSEWDGEAGRDNVFTIGLWWESLDRPWHNGLCSTGDQGGSANRPGTPPGSGTSTDAEKVGLRGTQGDEGPRWHSIAGAKTAKWQRFPRSVRTRPCQFHPVWVVPGTGYKQTARPRLEGGTEARCSQGLCRFQHGKFKTSFKIISHPKHPTNSSHCAVGRIFYSGFLFLWLPQRLLTSLHPNLSLILQKVQREIWRFPLKGLKLRW